MVSPRINESDDKDQREPKMLLSKEVRTSENEVKLEKCKRGIGITI